ncbi:MAG: SDR family oxidoreductase [Planctomycetota bacterium]|jgi:NAD(P)-dependent dehydrogenase (short-subunit alcohol dehydrogenase family)
MNTNRLEDMFDLSGRVAAVTGGGGVLCSTMAKALAALGVKVAILDIRGDAAKKAADEIAAAGGEAAGFKCDVLDKASVQAAHDAIIERFGGVDILINGAGGNNPKATTSDEVKFWDLPMDGFQWVFNLNFIGSVIPSQVFGRTFAEQDRGDIINISSMSAFRPLTRVGAYSAAKAAISNFTNWLAVHISQNYSKKVKVNAIAPGFFLTEQNRYLLTEEKTGDLTPRGKQVIDHTPMGIFGDPEDLVGSLVWLLSPSARFVHGTVIPVDGGFNAYSGV